MGESIQPISSAAMSALIQELDSGSTTLFGDPFAAGPTPAPEVVGTGKLARALNLIRRRVMPLVLQSMNSSKITVSHRSLVSDPSDPLATRYSSSEEEVYAAVSGPTTETLARGWTVIPAYEVLIAANDLSSPLDENDAVIIGGVSYDVVAIQGYPQVPDPVAYRYWLAGAA